MDTSLYLWLGYLALWMIPLGVIIHMARRLQVLDAKLNVLLKKSSPESSRAR